jgi:protein-tyrosine-phosphatase
VLFACTTNTVRSPMAEALLKRHQRQRIFVDSVGVRPGEPDPFAEQVMEEIGLTLVRHRSKVFSELEDSSFDLIVSLSPEAQHSAIELTRGRACEVEYWPILDPSIADGNRDSRLAVYRAIRDELRRRIEARFPAGGARAD